MSTQRDSEPLLEALEWYESLARQALDAGVRRDRKAVMAIMRTLAKDAGQCGMRARALNGDGSDSSDAGVGV